MQVIMNNDAQFIYLRRGLLYKSYKLLQDFSYLIYFHIYLFELVI